MSSFETLSERSHRGERGGVSGLPTSVADYAATSWQTDFSISSRLADSGARRTADDELRIGLEHLSPSDAGREVADCESRRNPHKGIRAAVREDLAFWIDVASHPDVRHVLDGIDPEHIETALRPPNIALRFEHGGFIFAKTDSFGRVYELHTLFKPEGWGKEVFFAARQAFDQMFEFCDLIITHETRHPQSKPPKTFRFVPLGDFEMTDHGEARLWMLTRDAWNTSPARKH